MLLNIINLFVEYIKLMLVLCGVLNYKFKRSWGVVAGFVAVIILLIFEGIIVEETPISAIIFLVIFLAAYSVEGKKRILFSIMAFVAISCVDELMIALFRIPFDLSYAEIAKNSFVFSLANSLSIILLLILSLALQKLYYAKKQVQNIQNSSGLYIILFAVGQYLALLYTGPFNWLDFGRYEAIRDVVVIGVCILSILFLVFGILVVYNDNLKKHYKKEADMNRKLLETQEQYYQMLLEKEEGTRRFRHDIKNHILCVDVLLKEKKYDEAENYLTQMKDVLDELRPKYQTGNMLVNAIVNDIAHRYEGVSLEWCGMLPKEMKLSKMDICTIFSNILENAFYAAAACAKAGNVSVLIKYITNSLMIVVENDMQGKIKQENGKLFTTKSDKNSHGIGTMNVATCVDVNGGSLDYNYTDKMFTTEIILPNII